MTYEERLLRGIAAISWRRESVRERPACARRPAASDSRVRNAGAADYRRLPSTRRRTDADAQTRLIRRLEVLTLGAFGFERAKEALHQRIVMEIPFPTHTHADAVALQHATVRAAGVLAAAVRMVDQPDRLAGGVAGVQDTRALPLPWFLPPVSSWSIGPDASLTPRNRGKITLRLQVLLLASPMASTAFFLLRALLIPIVEGCQQSHARSE